MTISAQNTAISYTGNGVTTVFAYNFRILDATHLKVYIGGVLQVAGYSVSGVDASGGGNVTFVAAPANGAVILFQRVTAKTQETDYVPYDPFPSETHERALDKLTMLVQESSSGADHSIKIPAAEDPSAVNTTVPAVAGRANQFVGFDASGNVIVGLPLSGVPVTPFMQTVLDDTTQLAARTTLGVSPGQLEAEHGPRNALVDLLFISASTGYRDLTAGGWFPAFMNQQWGGAPHYFDIVDYVTDASVKFEAATGYIEVNSGDATNGPVGKDAGTTWESQGFKVSKNTTVAAVWVKLGTVGLPTNNLELRILSDDGTGKPNGSTTITNGTATAQSGKLHPRPDDGGGQWVRFTFPTPPAVTAGTQYHVALKSSGAVDASNYWLWMNKINSFSGSAATYPYGQKCSGDATPTWTAEAARDCAFLIEAAAADMSIQTGGVFGEGKINFFEGSPLAQSNGRVKDLKDFRGLDLTDFTLAIYGASFTKDKTILDVIYGMDHDRITLRSKVTSGVAELTVLDSTGAVRTVTGTTDISGAGPFQIGIRIKAQNSGADVVQLFVNGASEGAPLTAQTFGFDRVFGRVGTLWLGGGFNLASAFAWNQKLSMGVLPSADSPAWTFGGAATEANAFAVGNNKLFQHRGGFTALQDGYYRKTALSLSNANGWAVGWKNRVMADPNTKDTRSVVVAVEDGTKQVARQLKEFYSQSGNYAGGVNDYVQVEMKMNSVVHFMVGKGSDSFTFANGRFISDGTGLMTTASGNNQITFGDTDTNSAENADVVWDYFAYYNAAWVLPQFTGGSISEFAILNGDRTAVLPTLWNGGAPFSFKQAYGAGNSADLTHLTQRHGITAGPTLSTASYLIAAEMEAFVVGSSVMFNHDAIMMNDTAGGLNYISAFIDGAQYNTAIGGEGTVRGGTSTAGAAQVTGAYRGARQVQFGLHKVEQRWRNVAVGTSTNIRRSLTVETKA